MVVVIAVDKRTCVVVKVTKFTAATVVSAFFLGYVFSRERLTSTTMVE